jgi:hypothetical protein
LPKWHKTYEKKKNNEAKKWAAGASKKPKQKLAAERGTITATS